MYNSIKISLRLLPLRVGVGNPHPSPVKHRTVSKFQVPQSYKKRSTLQTGSDRVLTVFSRVALSEMLRKTAKSFARAPMQINPELLLPRPDRPNVPVCRFGCCRGCRAALMMMSLIFAPVSTDFGPGPNLPRRRWRRGALLDGEFASISLSPPTSGLARTRWQRGSAGWGVRFSARLAAHLMPGSEAVA